MKQINFLPLVLVVTTILAACGKPPEAKAPRDYIQPVQRKTFPRVGPINLANSKIFLWKSDMSVADGSAARDISDKIDEFDAAAGPVNKEKDRLKGALDAQKRERSKTTTALTKAQKDLKTEQEKSEKSEDAIGKLTADVAKLTETKKTQDAQIAATDKDYKAVQQKSEDFDKRGKEQVDRLMEVSEYYNLQPSLYFDFKADGTIAAAINDWGLDDTGVQSFSTDAAEGKKPTIGNVKYEELGGVFVFDVYVYADKEKQDFVKDVFHFRLARIKLDDEAGRVFYGGEISRTRTLPDGKTEVRRGMAKCADRFN